METSWILFLFLRLKNGASDALRFNQSEICLMRQVVHLSGAKRKSHRTSDALRFTNDTLFNFYTAHNGNCFEASQPYAEPHKNACKEDWQFKKTGENVNSSTDILGG